MAKDMAANVSTTNILLVAAAVAIAGRTAQGKKFEWRFAFGGLVAVILVSVLDNFIPQVAKPLAAVALVAATLNYGPELFRKLSGQWGNAPESRAKGAF